MFRELGVLFVLCLSACRQRGGEVLRANAIATRASNKLFQLMPCKYDLLHVQAFTADCHHRRSIDRHPNTTPPTSEKQN